MEVLEAEKAEAYAALALAAKENAAIGREVAAVALSLTAKEREVAEMEGELAAAREAANQKPPPGFPKVRSSRTLMHR